MRVVGPNVFGIYSSSVMLNATFGSRDIRPGNVAIVTQSGAIGVAMIGKTKTENIGLSTIISVGNKSDISEVDLLRYLMSHKESQVILVYIEELGGERLVKALKMTAYLFKSLGPQHPVVACVSRHIPNCNADR